MFTDAQKRALVALAREAVRCAAGGLPTAVVTTADELPAASGAFVTLKRAGRLRGCIGTLECRRSLSEEITRVAVSAALEDPRFAPLTADELIGLDVEISVLGPLEEIDPHDVASIEIGCHGLVVEQGFRRGLLLPQVATEWGWDREEFLAQTSVKAGLPRDAWRRGARVCRFAAIVFGG
jgi:AmmeMemoRadiSam system protein A